MPATPEIKYPRVTWGDGHIRFKILVDDQDLECKVSRLMAFSLAIDILRALLFGERDH